MRMIGSLPSFRYSRSPGLTLASVLVVFYLAYQAARLVIAEDVHSLVIAGLFFVGCAIVVAILNDWRRGLYLLLGWILFEDFFRKYLGNDMAIFFAKDALCIVLYLSFFVFKRKHLAKSFRPAFLVPLLIFFWFAFLQIFNPSSSSLFFGLLGLKLNFMYIPLIFVGYALIESERELHKFFSYNSLLILVIAGLGVAQSVMGPAFLNPSVLQEDIQEMSSLYRAAPISGAVAYRPNSVFVSHGRFSNFLIVSWVLALGFAAYLLLRSRKNRNLAFLTVAVVGVGSVMSVSRGVLLWNACGAMVIAAAFLWGAPWRRGEARRLLRAFQRTLLAVGLSLTAMMIIFPEAVASRFAVYSETLLPSSPASELVFRSRDYPLKNLMLAFDHPLWPYGYGLGTCSLGIQYIARILHEPQMGINVENGYGQLLVELGIVGLALWIFFSLAVARSAWRAASSLRGTPWFPLGFVIFWYAFLLMVPMSYFTFVIYQDYVMNAYVWLMLGVLFRLPDLAQKTAQAEAQLAAASGQA